MILTNRDRLASLYGEERADEVMKKLEDLARHRQVRGFIVQVEANASVAFAYHAWASDPFNTAKANDVSGAVRNLVLETLETNPYVEYIVIVGSDEVVPFRRVLDRTDWSEGEYMSQASSGTTMWAACRDDMSLTDDYYADRTPSMEYGFELYVPDYAIGRLVETVQEITGAIDTFLAGHSVTAHKVLVTGYDFVAPEAQEMCATWRTDLGSQNTDCTLVGEGWTANELSDKQLNSVPRFDVQSINGHANHRLEGSPVLGGVSADEISTLGNSDLSRAVIYTLGCHSGFNDVGLSGQGQTGLDLPQAFARRRANYVANTGYGWGCTNAKCLSEQLMVNYSRELARGASVSIGKALVIAKQRYYRESMLGDEGYAYDEKILIESTLYGLPMYELITGGTLATDDPFPNVTITTTSPTAFGAFSESQLDFGLIGAFGAYDETETPDGSYLSLAGHVYTGAGDPVQPLFFASVSALGAGPARSAVFTGGRYGVQSGFDPIISQPVNEHYSADEPDFASPGWYPALPFTLHTRNTVSTTAESLVVVMGQYNSADGEERLYESMSFDLHHSASSDTIPPNITSVSTRRRGAEIDFKVAASDTSGLHRVIVAYTDGGGEWSSLDLVYDSAISKWTGSLTSMEEIEWFAQVVDGSGNVSTTCAKGTYHVARAEGERVYLPCVSKAAGH